MSTSGNRSALARRAEHLRCRAQVAAAGAAHPFPKSHADSIALAAINIMRWLARADVLPEAELLADASRLLDGQMTRLENLEMLLAHFASETIQATATDDEAIRPARA